MRRSGVPQSRTSLAAARPVAPHRPHVPDPESVRTRAADGNVTAETALPGDAFIGSFAHAYAASHDVVAALNVAVAYATDSVLRRGTQISYATRAEFDRFYPVMKEA